MQGASGQKIKGSYNPSNILFFFITVLIVVLLTLLIVNLSKDDGKEIFHDDVWTTSSCEGITNPAKSHPCYILGSEGECPLDLTPYQKFTYRGIEYHILNPTPSYHADFEYEVDLLLSCHLVDFNKLLIGPDNEHRQPHILLLDDYAEETWAHYTSGRGDCEADKRIVFPSQKRLHQHHGVLIHEFAHYFQDIIWSWDQSSSCDDDLFALIVNDNEDPNKYNDPLYGDGGVMGTQGWPYCYGLSDGRRGVPNKIELMAIITEGACAESTADADYYRVCGPSAAFLTNTANQPSVDQYLCLEELYGEPNINKYI